MSATRLTARDAVLVVDVQNDFCPGGALAVPDGDAVVPVLNCWIEAATADGAVVAASQDWHPTHHASFREQGGPWPPHCIQGTSGAQFAPGLRLPERFLLVRKGTRPDRDCYSAFEQSCLATSLRSLRVERVWIGGLALDFCVRATVLDALAAGFDVQLIADAVRAVDEQGGAGVLNELLTAGAQTVAHPPAGFLPVATPLSWAPVAESRPVPDAFA